jgi:hypothetical protein
MGRIRISPECEALKDEYANLIWDEEAFRRTEKREEHGSCDNHCTDATLYAWRYTYSYLAEELKAKPKVPSPEAYAQNVQALIDEHWRHELEDLDKLHEDENEQLNAFFEWHREQ